MYLNNLKIVNFRKIEKLNLLFNKTNLFIGDNAVGKTSVLEAIYYLAYTKSFKADYKNVVNFNGEFIKLEGNNLKDLLVIDTGSKTKITVDGILVTKKTDYIGSLLVLLYSPTDNVLVKAEPSYKRRFINMTYGLLDNKYLDDLNMYNKILKNRNILLKESKDLILLDIITEDLVKYNEIIKEKRTSFIELINSKIVDIHKTIASQDEELKLEYVTTNNIKEKLDKTREYDLVTGTTNSGIHRDNLKFKINGKDASDFASTGQIRTILLSLNLALLEIIYEAKGTYPLLLLDDCFNEIDKTRIKNFINLLGKKQVQVFITGTDENIINEIEKHDMKVFYMSNGCVTKEENYE